MMIQLLRFIVVGILLGCSLVASGQTRSPRNSQTIKNVHSQQQIIKQKQFPKVCFYIENSGSMRGYIHRGNKFERTLCSMESELAISDFANIPISLYYINKSIVNTPKNLKFNDYVYDVLNPQKYQSRANVGESSFSTMFDMILQRTDPSTLSIFVSDCIFSVGRTDANQYIATEKDNIKKMINRKIKQHPNFAILVYCFKSNFNGYFYNHVDAKKKINTTRPFYVWVFGEKDAIRKFRYVVSENKIENEVVGEYLFYNSNHEPIWTMLTSSSSGKLIRDNGMLSIKKAKLVDGKFRITLVANLKDYECLGNRYLINKNNYSVSPKQYKIVSIKKRQSSKSTHVITLETTQKVTPTKVKISLQNPLPLWINKYNLNPNESSKIFTSLDKTYGIKSLIMGVYSGYNVKGNSIGSININVNQ